MKILSEDEMNSLGARILRAELMGEEVSGKPTLITDLAKFCTVIQHNTTILPSVNTVALLFLSQFNLLACRTWPNS